MNSMTVHNPEQNYQEYFYNAAFSIVPHSFFFFNLFFIGVQFTNIHTASESETIVQSWNLH